MIRFIFKSCFILVALGILGVLAFFEDAFFEIKNLFFPETAEQRDDRERAEYNSY